MEQRWTGEGEVSCGMDALSILQQAGASHVHRQSEKKAKATDENHFLFLHKELGHPLIIVNHAINLSVAQMNTALGMRQSLLACYVSLTQFILLFTQDHSYVKLCEGVSLSLSVTHTHTAYFSKPRACRYTQHVSWMGVNVC